MTSRSTAVPFSRVTRNSRSVLFFSSWLSRIAVRAPQAVQLGAVPHPSGPVEEKTHPMISPGRCPTMTLDVADPEGVQEDLVHSHHLSLGIHHQSKVRQGLQYAGEELVQQNLLP